MKKVLQILPYYPPSIGGIEQVGENIVDSLAGHFEQAVICFHHMKGAKTEDTMTDGVRIIRVKAGFKISSQSIALGYRRELKRLLAEFKPDYIHFHFPNPFASQYLLAQKFNAELIVHWHSDIIKQKFLKHFFIGQTNKLLVRASRIIATSPNYIEASDFLPLFRDKCTVITNTIDDKRLITNDAAVRRAAEIRKQHEGKTIGFFIGRHVIYKGLEYLIKAAPLLDKNVVILIGGSGPLTASLQKMARPYENIHFLGTINNEELTANLLASDMFVFPSVTKNEAFGIALAEAMRFGKPSVTYTIEGSGVNYVSLDGVTGIECKNSDVQELASAINKLSADAALREEYGANAKKRVEENFLFGHFSAGILDLYSCKE